jgi:sulfite exporter TauE/SafE
MPEELAILTLTAASVGLIHTLLGPDHYLPFIVLARARGWSIGRTAWITTLCGLGHVLSSVVLGLFGIVLGVAVSRLEVVEAVRGDLAAWLLIAVGLVYGAWGLHRATRSHAHQHDHRHSHPQTPTTLTPWMLFLVFVLGPCEPLIPILMVPAATGSVAGAMWVAGVFGVVTLTTMLAVVTLALAGVRRLPLGTLERYSHALAGGAICSCGLGMRFLGL